MTEDEKALLAWWLAHPADALTATIQPDHFGDLRSRRLAHVVQRRGWTHADALGALATPYDPDQPSECTDPTGVIAHTELVDFSRGFQKAQADASADRVRQRFAAKAAEASAVAFLEAVRRKGPLDISGLIQGHVRGLAEAEAMAPIQSRTHAEVGLELLTDWTKSITDPERVRTLPMPWADLQAHTGGWPIEKLILIGGRSSEHKTTVARAAAAYLASLGIRTAYWTAEDSDADISGRTLADASRLLDTRSLMLGRLPKDKGGVTEDQFAEILKDATDSIQSDVGKNLRIIDMPNPALSTVLGMIKAEVAKGARAFFFDFIQLIRPDRGIATNDWWRECVAALAGLAKQLEIPIIATSQIEKTGTQASAGENRIPRADEMPFGAVLRQGCFGALMVGTMPTDHGVVLGIEVDKWKSAENLRSNEDGGRFLFDVDPAHDRLIERKKS